MNGERCANFYLAWRTEREAAGFREGSAAPSEHVVQQIWQYQRLRREELQTCDGQPVRILHPGFWNDQAGPDFKKAIVQVGSETRTGDIEIDLVPGGWQQHAHHKSEAYKKVILHVVWQATGNLHGLPTLELKSRIDSPLEELVFWLGANPGPAETTLGQCSAPLRHLEDGVVREILKQAARARLQYKAELLQATARQSGWEQALWEGIFGALGYSANVWPMRRLAELSPLVVRGASAHSNPVLLIQSRLFGLAGLLPSKTEEFDSATHDYVQELWQLWWREADSFRELALPRAIWKLGGIRPANHPERRIALAAHWLARGELPGRFEGWLERAVSENDLGDSMERLLTVPLDTYWNFHFSFGAAPLKNSQPLVGANRATDIAINIVLPWLWIRALAGRNKTMQASAEGRYFAWPRAQDNTVLKFARQRLFGSEKAGLLRSAAEQQGLLQIVRDFCDQSNARCDNCPFPDLLRAVKGRDG